MTIDRQTTYHAMRIVLALIIGAMLFFAELAAQLYFHAVERLQRAIERRRLQMPELRRVSDFAQRNQRRVPDFAQKF